MAEEVGPPLSRAGSASIPPPAPEELLNPAAGPSLLGEVAGGVTKSALAFLNNQTVAEADSDAANLALVKARTSQLHSEVEADSAAAADELEIQKLSRIAFGGGEDADAALAELFARDPQQADALFEGLGAIDESARQEASRDAAAIQALPQPERRAAILERAARIEAQGRDASETLSLLDMDPEQQNNQLRIIQAAALTTAQRATQAGGGGTPAEQQTFEALIASMSPEDQVKARRIEAGLDPRASISANERIALNEELAALVAASQADIKEAGKFAEMTGSSRAKAIDSGFETIQNIDANIRNLDRAVEALDAGAETGAIVSRFTPTLREQSVVLQQIQASLGLDVVQSVSFGALSEGELRLALATALPINLDQPALRQWIVDRQAAQRKLRGYFSRQIDFLDTGGTVAGFLRQERKKAGVQDVDGFTVVEVKEGG